MISRTKQILVLFVLTLTQRTVHGMPSLDYSAKIDPKLLQALETKRTANVIVLFFTDTQEVLDSIADIRFPTRDDLLIALNSALEQNAQLTQVNVTQFLNQLGGISYESLWINNHLFIRDADIQIVLALTQFGEVRKIIEDPEFSIDVIERNPANEIFGRDNSLLEWGVVKIQSAEANSYLELLSDSGQVNISSIRVGIIDTGARHTHQAIRDNFLGEYGWYDPYEKTPIPYDNNGHGTHVTGTICGKYGIGVYPDAIWMACKGCRTTTCAYSDLIACGQFVTCPTTPDGLTKNCAKAPHVVSNSWSFLRGNFLFDSMLNAWHTAQIIPVFSIGNDGQCDTAKSPGDRNAIGVGSTSFDDAISFFSSKGPSVDGKIKPDIVAPGSLILSAYHRSDDSYIMLSGTSMACPHVSGLVTLLKACDPELGFEEIVSLLAGGAEIEDLQWDGTICEEGVVGDEFPNHIFGHGRINALRSLQLLVA